MDRLSTLARAGRRRGGVVSDDATPPVADFATSLWNRLFAGAAAGRGAAGAADLPVLRRHLGRGHAELVRQPRPRSLPVLVRPRQAAALAGALQLRRSLQLRRGLRHDRGGAQPVLAARRVRDAASAERARRHRRARRLLEARQRAGRPARRLLRRALPAADAQLLRPDVQQPQGHPVRRGVRLGDLLPGAHRAVPAAPAAAPRGQAGGGDRAGDGGAGRRAAARLLSRADAGAVRGVAGVSRRGGCRRADRHGLDQPVAGLPAGRAILAYA